jgi:Protein tyrosine phosphatase-like protein, PTPLA
LEIAHALFRLVRSPVMVTAMQVMSRIVALVAIAYAPAAQGAFPSFCEESRL